MKILEVNTEKTWRGGERQTYYNIKGFKEAGQQVELLSLKGYPLEQKSKELNIPIHCVNNGFEAIKWITKYGRNYDIIHVQTAKALTYAVITKPFHQKPVVYTRRVDFVPKGKLTLIKYKLADRVVAITTPIKEILENFGLSDVELITEIVEKKELNRERAHTFLKEHNLENKKIIATTSALVPHKDPITMVKAVKELSKIRDDFVFLHFGDGELKEEVENAIKEMKLEDLYYLMGFYDNVEDFFLIFDLFVMSSKEEGLGSSVLDAFIYKVPVVSTDAGGLKESVGNRGLLCPVGDYKCLAESMNRVLSDENLRNELIKKGFERAITYHSLERVTEEYLKLFKEILVKEGR
ncbi:glycosyltransferase family 4 protein [Persephonella sp.]